VATGCCVLTGIAVSGRKDSTAVVASVATVLSVSKAAYDSFYQPTGIAGLVERNVFNVGTINGTNVVVGNGNRG